MSTAQAFSHCNRQESGCGFVPLIRLLLMPSHGVRLLILTTLVFFSAGLFAPSAHAQQDRDLLAACFPSKWTAALPPLPTRVQAAPQAVVAYLTRENQQDGIPLVPAAVAPAAVFTDALQSILKDLSPPLRKVLEKHLTGIYTVRDLGSSGFTEEYRSKEKQRYAFIALDADVLLHMKLVPNCCNLPMRRRFTKKLHEPTSPVSMVH